MPKTSTTSGALLLLKPNAPSSQSRERDLARAQELREEHQTDRTESPVPNHPIAPDSVHPRFLPSAARRAAFFRPLLVEFCSHPEGEPPQALQWGPSLYSAPTYPLISTKFIADSRVNGLTGPMAAQNGGIRIFDHLTFTPKSYWKIDRFRVATGETGSWRDDSVRERRLHRRKGRVRLMIESYQSRNRNKVEDDVDPSEENPPPSSATSKEPPPPKPNKTLEEFREKGADPDDDIPMK